MVGEAPAAELVGEDAMAVRWPVASGALEIICRPDELEFRGVGLDAWELAFVAAARAMLPVESISGNELRLRHEGYAYRLWAKRGHFAGAAGRPVAKPEAGAVCWRMAQVGAE